MPIMLHNGQNMASLGFELRYDPSVVQVTNVGQGSLVALISNTPQAGRIIFGFAGTQAISGDGSAAIVIFRAVGAQGSSSALTLSKVEATNASGASVSVKTFGGQVTIGQLSQGDINGDNKVSALDALRALRMYVQLEAGNLILDMNGDGRITPEDARLILEMAKPAGAAVQPTGAPTQPAGAPVQVAGGPWPMFRHDLQHTGRSPFTGPENPVLKWSYTTGDTVKSSPAIGSDGTIYVGSYDENLYAINPNGSLKWSFTTVGGVHSSPAIGSDGTIYVGSDDDKLFAIRGK